MPHSSPSSRLGRIRLLLWIAVAILILVIGAAGLWRITSRSYLPEPQVTGEADIRNDYTLTDHTGREVTPADFTGRWQLVFFGFTYCPDICPTTLAYMASVMDLLGPQVDQVVPIFITVDPQRDTVPVMAEYVSAFHPRLVGLTGSEAQTAKAADNFRVWFERTEDDTAPDGYLMAHSGYIYLMRPDGKFEAVFLEGDQPPEDLAQEILTRIDKDQASR